MAHGGTIFLDEVAEMAPTFRSSCCALESRTIRRLGGKRRSRSTSAVAATNRNLQKALAEGELREDLDYRLAVVEIFLPPLRERLGDVKLLANEFITRYAQQNGKQVTGFDNDAWAWILNYRWPGNVRELKNAVERAVIMARGSVITADDVTPRHLRPGADTGEHPAVSPPRRRASDRGVASENGSSTVLGMTRDELFDAFSRFLSAKSDVARASALPKPDFAVAATSEPDVDEEPEDAVVAERAQPAKAHAKAKAKKRR
jgi:transcriptional regulator with PAS, ATPase and Fis domain